MKGTLLDVLLTNKPKSFRKTFLCETGLSDCHNLVATIFRSTFAKLPPRKIRYRSYKNLNNKVCYELDQIHIQRNIDQSNDLYSKSTEISSDPRETCFFKMKNDLRKSGPLHQ